jgi:lipoprotein-releasing system permease protein
MYKFLLCWRYLRTRYIALASIISVMLGVATMIVVNSVMEGFTHELRDHLHSILSDVVFESQSLDGFPDAEKRMAEIRNVAGDFISGMSPTVHVPAMIGYTVGSQYITHQVTIIGVDEATCASVSDFEQFLQHPDNRKKLDFNLKAGGYDVVDHRALDSKDAIDRPDMAVAGWEIRKRKAAYNKRIEIPAGAVDNPFAFQKKTPDDSANKDAANAGGPAGTEFDPAKEQHVGCIAGIGLCQIRTSDHTEGFLALPGDDVEISYPTVSKPPKVLSAKFTITDFYESKMADYDQNFVFVPIKKLQELRGMVNPSTGVANCTAIQIRLKPGVKLDEVRDLLRNNFSPVLYRISTWQDKEGAIITAARIETALLNILLFLIVAVAGFGILAIFYMIVIEKTRDIGILKSLGASSRGIMMIFLSYGLSLGVVGAGMGLIVGLLFVRYITNIAAFLSRILGMDFFDSSVYGMPKIPTIVRGFTVSWIIGGALLIAILASILPARRAARLHPVEALRHE